MNPRRADTEDILALFRAGVPPGEIARRMRIKSSAVGRVLTGARRRGDLPAFAPRTPLVQRLRSKGFPIGNLTKALEDQPEALLRQLARVPGAKDMAEALVKVALAHFEQQQGPTGVDPGDATK